MSWFKKKETLDGYSEDTTWHGFMTVMSSRMTEKGEKCKECGKKTNVLYTMAAGSTMERCKDCTDKAEDNLISQCPSCYLFSFEEYKEWKRKHEIKRR